MATVKLIEVRNPIKGKTEKGLLIEVNKKLFATGVS